MWFSSLCYYESWIIHQLRVIKILNLFKPVQETSQNDANETELHTEKIVKSNFRWIALGVAVLAIILIGVGYFVFAYNKPAPTSDSTLSAIRTQLNKADYRFPDNTSTTTLVDNCKKGKDTTLPVTPVVRKVGVDAEKVTVQCSTYYGDLTVNLAFSGHVPAF